MIKNDKIVICLFKLTNNKQAKYKQLIKKLKSVCLQVKALY